MRKLTRQLVVLLAVFVIYFGYSAWIDSTALYKISSITPEGLQNIKDHFSDLTGVVLPKTGDLITKANSWVMDLQGVSHTGIMAQDSLLYTVLSPFKLVLVGGVFALLIPLTKTLFFGTFIGIKDYMKARRTNVLFNYQNTIAFATTMKSKLESGDYEQIKAQYAAFAGLAFKPRFLITMMDEIGNSLIREQDMSVFIKPSEVIIKSVKEMYEKERKLAISMKPDEMFFDLKRGYEYISIGSKYSIAYFKEVDTGANSPKRLGWKLFSLEMYKFYLAMLGAIIPTVILAVIILPLLGKFTSAAGAATPGVIFGMFMIFAIAIHATVVFSNSQYRQSWKDLIKPAITYYVILLLLAFTFVIGLNGVINLGSIIEPSSTTKMWPWFSAVANLVLTTTLLMYVMSTLMDGLTSPLGLTNKLSVDGIVLPLIAWLVGFTFNLYGTFSNNDDSGIYTGVGFGVALGFWIYLSISGVLLNNIVLPSKKRKIALQAELAQEGQEALEKRKNSK